MSSNPKRSAWYSTPQNKRTKKVVSITLSDEARARLDELADERVQNKSTVVEELIMSAKRKK